MTLKLLLWPVPVLVGLGWVDGFMSFYTEGGRELVKIQGWKLWIKDLNAEESGVIRYK